MKTSRVDAAATTWIFREDESRRRRGYNADIPCEDESRRRRGYNVDSSWAEAAFSRCYVPTSDPRRSRGVDATTVGRLQAGLQTGCTQVLRATYRARPYMKALIISRVKMPESATAA